MCEDVARLGEPVPIDPGDVAKLHERYTTQFGQ